MTLPTTPSFRLDGRRALVTGAGRGIGLAIAAALAEAGASVTLMARTTGEIEAGADAIRAKGLRAEARSFDVLDIAGIRRIVGSLPTFDIFVNNAGANRPSHFLDVTEEDFDALMQLNVRAEFSRRRPWPERWPMTASKVRSSIYRRRAAAPPPPDAPSTPSANSPSRA